MSQPHEHREPDRHAPGADANPAAVPCGAEPSSPPARSPERLRARIDAIDAEIARRLDERRRVAVELDRARAEAS